MTCLLAALLAAGPILITEVMPNPAGGTGAHQPEDRNEFVELYNSGNEAIDLYNWTLDDGDGTDRLITWEDSSVLAANPGLIINETWLRPGGYAVVLDSEYTDPAPAGGFIQPYRFGDGTLLLTTGNTTIGNGLATTDPLIITSPYGDTATWGTPFDATDSIPCNPGDGISWERIAILRPDTIDNWAVCPDSSGSTPGRANAAGTAPDLRVCDLALADPAALVPGEAFSCSIRLANDAHVPVADWDLTLFLDTDGNEQPGPGETTRRFAGWSLPARSDTVLPARFTCPHVRTDLWARLVCPGDPDTADNRLRLTIDPAGAARCLSLATPGFSPDGDGFEDSLSVVYRLPEAGGRLQIKIFDLGGRVIRDLHEEQSAEDQGVVRWDGRTDAGNMAPAGIYAVWLRCERSGTDIEERSPVALYR